MPEISGIIIADIKREMRYVEDGIYRRMYARLFNRVTDAIIILEREGEQAAKMALILAQRETERMFMDEEEPK